MSKETEKAKAPPLDKRLKGINELPLEFRKKLKEAQIQCVLRYVASGQREKLKAIYQWRVKKAQFNVTTADIAKAIKRPDTRVSEYLNFRHEPQNPEFRKIEMLLFRLCR